MKAILVALFLLLLFVLSLKPLVGVSEAALEPVLDTSGKKLRVGANYYMVPARGGSGFALASLGNKTCPLDVVVVEGYHGQPLTFIPVNPQEGNTNCIQSTTTWLLQSFTWQFVNRWMSKLVYHISSSNDSRITASTAEQLTAINKNPKGDVVCVSVDLNIKFSAQSGCSESTVWKIDRFDRSTRKWFVTTGGVVGSPSWRTIENWFKIEKYGNDYKLVYCPTICEYCRVHCRDVAVYEDKNGDKRLALTDVPYEVRFQQT